MRTSPTLEAAAHANEAARYLHIVQSSYPRVATRLWVWFSHSFLRAGKPLDALAFLFSLRPGCCDLAAVSRIRGDALFTLQAEPEAAAEYSYWISESKESSCGSEISLAHISYLQMKGFEFPSKTMKEVGGNAICMQVDQWHPFVRLSAEYMK